MKNRIIGSSILLLMCVILNACDAEETQIIPAESYVKDASMTLSSKDVQSSPTQDPVELVFFDCESKISSHPPILDVVCYSEDLTSGRVSGMIRSDPCTLFSGCYPGLKLNIKDLIIITLAAKSDASINIFSDSGKLAASSLTKFGGSSIYDDKTRKMTFSFGVVNEDLFSNPMFLQVKTSYLDLKGNLIEVDEKVEIEKDFLQL